VEKSKIINWTDDVDTSITPIGIVHHGPAPTTNVNTSVNLFPAAHGTSGPTTLNSIALARLNIHPKTIVKLDILAGTIADTHINVTLPQLATYPHFVQTQQTHGQACANTIVTHRNLNNSCIANTTHAHTPQKYLFICLLSQTHPH
jgi:hypothetical protein